MVKYFIVQFLILVIEFNCLLIAVRSWTVVRENRRYIHGLMKCSNIVRNAPSLLAGTNTNATGDQTKFRTSKSNQGQNPRQIRQRAFAQSIYQMDRISQPTTSITEIQISTFDIDDITSSPSTLPRKEKKPFNSDSTVGSLHKKRITLAGRVGTKRFSDPCKVYIGNLPFRCTDELLRDYVSDIVGLPDHAVINQCKIVIDWKTGRSKGYGFVVMTEPIYATILIDKCDRNATIGSMDNRRLTVSQGKSTKAEKQLLIEEQKWLMKQQRKSELTEEDSVIESGISEAAQMTEDEIRMLKRLDPDLVPEYFKEIHKESTTTNNEIAKEDKVRQFETDELEEDDDAEIEYDESDDVYNWEEIDNGEIYDDSDDGVDGIWDSDDNDNYLGDIIEFSDERMNREQRRNATAAEKKKRKLPYKGFG